jgi:hypothetical protein
MSVDEYGTAAASADATALAHAPELQALAQHLEQGICIVDLECL